MRSSLLDHPVIEQRYFFPRNDPIPEPFWIDCDGARLACAYHEISPTAKTLIHFHGNGEVVADYLDGFPQLIGQMGCNCLMVEYRGYGLSSGRPQLGRMLEDVPHVIQSAGCPIDRVVLFGRSVGSLFAIHAAGLFPEAAGLVLESGIADLLERLLLRLSPEEIGSSHSDLAATLETHLNLQRSLQNFTNPALILHCRNDGLVDVKHAEQLTAWCGGPVTLQIFEEGTHNDILFVNGPQYFGLIMGFLEQLP